MTSAPVLRINGEREVAPNVWRRFAKEFSIPPYCDHNEVSAKFERGMLYVKFPIPQATPSKPHEEEAITSPPEEPKPEPEPEPEPKAEPEPEPKVKPEPVAQAQEGDQQKSQQKEKERIKDEKEKSKEAALSEVAAGDDKKVRTNGVTKTAETTTPSKAHEEKGAKMAQRLKTRVVDFTLSLRSADDKDVNQCWGGLVTGLRRRPKILMNIIVGILLVMVLGTYIKNAFKSSDQGGSKFQEF